MAQQRPDGMEPIESAAKDGRNVIVWREGYGLYSVRWAEGGWLCGKRPIPAAELTHWMAPYPNAPLEQRVGMTTEDLTASFARRAAILNGAR